jgi:CHASE1-domain containing sensor protein
VSDWAWRVVESSAFSHAFACQHMGATFAASSRATCYYDGCAWAMSAELEAAGRLSSWRFVCAVLGSFGAAYAAAVAVVTTALVESVAQACGFVDADASDFDAQLSDIVR